MDEGWYRLILVFSAGTTSSRLEKGAQGGFPMPHPATSPTALSQRAGPADEVIDERERADGDVQRERNDDENCHKAIHTASSFVCPFR